MGASSFIEKALAGRWIAGSKINDAIAVGKKFNSHGIKVIVNYLGEGLRDKAQVKDSIRAYNGLILAIRKADIDAEISVKASQLGLSISRSLAEKNYSRLVKVARKSGIFVWLDMEEHRYVDETIGLYKTELRGGGVGICIQSYLKRSHDDLRGLVRLKAVVRLVKGAYKTNSRMAYGSRQMTTENYVRLMTYLFKNADGFTIATHDLSIIEEAIEQNRSYRRNVTYSMLNGIRNAEAVRLAATNKVAVYVPFGERWLDYAFRRLKEEGHLTLIIRSIFQSQRI